MNQQKKCVNAFLNGVRILPKGSLTTSKGVHERSIKYSRRGQKSELINFDLRSICELINPAIKK